MRGRRWPAAGKDQAPGIARTADGKVAEVIRLTQAPPPHEATHWTIRAMGKGRGAGGLDRASDLEGARLSPASLASVQAVQRSGFRAETAGCGGPVCRARPPMRWCCRSMRKSQIQALDRTQPGVCR